ncbi:SGNH/GDSL hydrolase family protein [Eggerthellaceae bacterium zg-997]|nr:SGNH/GDSL hydrolase family protein [Eggerthellaceae bacterium zg-997]
MRSAGWKERAVTRWVSVLGDSISTFEGVTNQGFAVFYEGALCADTGVRSVGDTWWMQVIDALGGTLLRNGAWSGSCVQGAGHPAGCSLQRARALARWDDGAPNTTPDDVLVYIGINDYGWGSELNHLAARGNALPECLSEDQLPAVCVPAQAERDAAERFGEAYEAMLRNVRTMYPQARVWCLSLVPGRVRGCARSTHAYAFRGEPFAAYNQAIARASRAAGCRFCDATALGYDLDTREGTHPTALGMEQLAWLACRAMATAGEEGFDPAVLTRPYPGGEGFRSDDPCVSPGRSCVGCPHALDTSRTWMHVCCAREHAARCWQREPGA